MKIKIFSLILLFAITRFYVFNNPPASYSDVTADYERYANMWRYGLTPYTEHLYEYPPATIPLLSLPLSLDQAGIGKYYQNYRTQILVVDTLLFLALLYYLSKSKYRFWFQQLFLYILLTAIAKDFLYEGLDLVFTGTFILSILVATSGKKLTPLRAIISWGFFWISVALKFLTAPLLVPLGLGMILRKKKLDLNSISFVLATLLIGFLIVWIIPLIKYRSSLSVSFVHNFQRPMKYASYPSHVIRWVDTFTHSESQIMKAPDFQFVGPVSEKITNIDKIVFPLSLLGFITWVALAVMKIGKGKINLNKTTILEIQHYLLNSYGLYIFILFLTAKTFSQPFHIWYLPVIALLPFEKVKILLLVFALSLLMVLLDTTSLLGIKSDYLFFNQFPIALVRDSLRFLPMFYFVWFFGSKVITFKNK